MKKYLFTTCLMLFLTQGNAQAFTSNKITNWGNFNNSITIHDAENNQILNLKMRFKYNHGIKKKIKPFKIGDKNYVIAKESKGFEHVYTKDWKLVARITRNGRAIELVDSGQLYRKSNVGNKLFRKPDLIYIDGKDDIVAKARYGTQLKYEYTNYNPDEVDSLLMAIILHLLDEETRKRQFDNLLYMICP